LLCDCSAAGAAIEDPAMAVSECRARGHVTVAAAAASRDSGYISSAVRPPGGADCGWRLGAGVGQRLQLTLAAFGGDGSAAAGAAETEAAVRRTVSGGRASTCHDVGSVWDGADAAAAFRGRGTPLVICGPGNADRRRHVLLFLSESNSVVIRLKSRGSLQHIAPFLIKYTGVATHLHNIT